MGYTKQEIFDIVDSNANFEAYLATSGGNISEGEGIDGMTLGLVQEIFELDGEDITDGECLELIQEAYSLYKSVQSRVNAGVYPAYIQIESSLV